MWKSLLVVLNDATVTADAAAWGLHWAKSNGGTLVGLSAIDVERLTGNEAVPLGGMAYKEERDELRLAGGRQARKDVIQQFQKRATVAGVSVRTVEAEGALADIIAREAQCCDAIVLDRPNGADATVGGISESQFAELVKQCPCPVVVVPQLEPSPCDVLIAYDGSPQAAHAVQAFALSGLANGRAVRVVGVGRDREVIALANSRAVEYLKSHEITATAIAIDSDDVAESLRLELLARPATMLVMGAYGPRTWREFLFGSVTKALLASCPGPIFLTH